MIQSDSMAANCKLQLFLFLFFCLGPVTHSHSTGFVVGVPTVVFGGDGLVSLFVWAVDLRKTSMEVNWPCD